MNRKNMMGALVVVICAAMGCAGEPGAPAESEVVQQTGECSVSLQCANGSTISCNGTNSQCSVGTNSVTCNGVTTACVPPPSCVWNGATYAHGATLSGQCSARIDGVCRTGAFTGSECNSNIECTARCDNGDWVPRF